MDLNDLFKTVMSGGIADQIGKVAGVEDSQQAESAVGSIFSSILGGIQNNVSTQEGAESLDKALDNDHDGSLLDNLSGLLGGVFQPDNAKTTNGVGILGHVFGNNQGNVAQAVSQQTGIDAGKIMNMMVMIAPIVMGLLGKAKKTTGMDAGGLVNILGSVLGGQAGSNPILSVLGGILGGGQQQQQQANGGGILDDLLKGGVGNILGGIFGGKK